jgi:hypothetical protein
MFQESTKKKAIRVSRCEFYVSQLYDEVMSSLCILLLILSFLSHQGLQIDLLPFDYPNKIWCVCVCVRVCVCWT